MKKKLVFFGVVAITAAYLTLAPSDYDPAPVEATPDPGMTGTFAPNNALAAASHIKVGEGPEDIAKGQDGYFYTGLQDGRIVRFREDGGSPETYANTGGRPLGMQFDAAGNLIVADAFKGLLAVDQARRVRVLTDNFKGKRFVFTDDLDIAPDGTIWFTNASERFDQHRWKLEMFEMRPTGSLLTYDPSTRMTTEIARGFMFANGVALGPRAEFVLVNETFAARVTRLWLKGPRTGQRETFLNLPGYPDNLSFNGKDTFWVAVSSPRNKALERTWNSASLRRSILRIPERLLFAAGAPKFSWAVGVDTNGKVVRNLQDSAGASGNNTSVNEFDGKLFLGSITAESISYYSLP